MRHNQIRGRRLTFHEKKQHRARDNDEYIAYQLGLKYRNRKSRGEPFETAIVARKTKSPAVIVREVWILRIIRLVIAYFKNWRRKAKT